MEIFRLQHILQEINIRLDAADAEFFEAAQHPVNRVRRPIRVSRDLDEKRVVIRRDHRARVRRARIEANPRTAAGAIRDDFSRVGHKAVLRILRRNPALDRHTVIGNILLPPDADLVTVQRIPLGDQNLRLHDIHITDELRHRVLHLHSRIHFDKIEMFLVLVHQKFARPGIEILHVFHEFHGRGANFLTKGNRQRPRRRHFNDLLMTALNRAVALVKMHDISRFIAQNLHLDVLRIHDALFDVHRIVAESHLRFRFRAVVRLFEILNAIDIAHPAPAAAGHRLDHDGEPVRFRKFLHFFKRGNGALRPRNHRDVRSFRLNTRIHLIAEHRQMLDRRSDESNPRRLAARRKLRILRQESVPRMDRVHPVLLGDTNDIVHIQIRVDRFLPRTDQIRLIRAIAVE